MAGGGQPHNNMMPTLFLNYCIAMQGAFPPATDPRREPHEEQDSVTMQYMGEIRIMSFNFAPKNWALCNGQILSIAQNQALFSLLGTTYGGNGVTTFALPDLRTLAPGA